MMMKYVLVLLLIACMFSNCSSIRVPSSNTEVISVNFKDRKVMNGDHAFREGEEYQVLVKNINQNIWKIELDYIDTVTSKPLSISSVEDLNIAAMTSLVSSFNNTVGIDLFEPILENLGGNGGADELLMEVMDGQDPDHFRKYIDSLTRNLEVNGEGLSEEEYQANWNKEKRALYEKKCRTELRELMSREREALHLQIRAFQGIGFQIQDTEKKLFHYKMKLVSGTLDYVAPLVDFRNLFERFDSLDIRSKQLYYDVFDHKTKLYEQLEEVEIDTTIEGLKEYFNENRTFLNTAYDTLLQQVLVLKKQVAPQRIEKSLYSIMNLYGKGDSDYKSFNRKFKEGAVVQLKFSPKQPEFGLQTHTLNIPLKKRPDYYSLGLSYYLATLSSDKFSAVPVLVDDSTRYQLVEEDGDKLEFGISSMLRMGTKLGAKEYLGIHGSLGPGINFGKTIRPRLLLGGGVSFGRKHNLTLDFGLAMGFVDRKSSNVSTEVNYLAPPDNIFITRLKTGGFISLGYLYRLN